MYNELAFSQSIPLSGLGCALPAPAEPAVPDYVARAQAGDARAFREIYQLYRREVARLVGRMLGPRGDVEDVVQEAFFQVFRSLPGFRGESRFRTWLHRVTVNTALGHLRAARSRPLLVTGHPDETPDETSDSPHEAAARRERMDALYRILGRVAEKKRTVFVLHDLEAMPAAQIAEVVGAPVLTVRTRLFYARQEVYAAMARDPLLGEIAREVLPQV